VAFIIIVIMVSKGAYVPTILFADIVMIEKYLNWQNIYNNNIQEDYNLEMIVL